MSASSNSYKTALTEKLDAFIRKYYTNEALRGGLLFGGVFVVGYLALALGEYFGHFGSSARTALVWSFMALSVIVFGRFVALPLLKLFRVTNIISHWQAAGIVGNHFEGITDKLLNTLQLHELLSGHQSPDLVLASIEQKTAQLKPFQFTQAVDLKENLRYLKWLAVPVALFFTIYLYNPGVFQESTGRLINYSQEYVPQAPFSFVISNNHLNATASQDFNLEMVTEGKVLPGEVKLEMKGAQFRMKNTDVGTWSHVFRNPQQNIQFRFNGGGFYSQWHTLSVNPQPALLHFKANLDFPQYTEKKDQSWANVGDLTVPQGTRITWEFNTQNSDRFLFSTADTSISLQPTSADQYSHAITAMRDLNYSLTSINAQVGSSDSTSYFLKVIPDEFPSIQVIQEVDSTKPQWLYFRGSTSDDYGISAVSLEYQISNAEGGVLLDSAIHISTSGFSVAEDFFHTWNLDQLGLAPGAKVNYNFRVWDNDGVNGAKSTRSDVFTYVAPTEREIREQKQEKSDQLKQQLAAAKSEAKELQQEIQELSQKLVEKKSLDWEDRQQIKDLLDRQKTLEQEMKEAQQMAEESRTEVAEEDRLSEEILKKQEQVQKLFEELMSDEMKEMMAELEELLQQMNKDQIQEQLEDLEMSAEDMEKELDQALENFKRMEVEMKLEQAINDLEDLQKDQQALSEQSQESEGDQQESLNERFEQLTEDLKDLEQKNQELEQPMDELESTQSEQQQISEQMDKAADDLEKGKDKKANESQQNAADQMEQMAQNLQAMMDQMQQEQQAEDLDAMRQLLENLVQLSFDQEKVMVDLENLANANPREHVKDPLYVKLGQQQKKLKDDAKMIEDSLFALSKRQPAIEATVNREMSAINMNMDKTLTLMTERKTSQVTAREQLIMTSVNELALMFDEIVQQMQQQMAQQMYGEKACNKPGQGQKPSASPSKSMQKQMEEMLEKMRQEAGKMPNGQKPGGQSGQGSGMSEKLAKMAAQQQKMRSEIRKMAEQAAEQQGEGGKDALEDLQQLMEDNERDIINRNITQETVRRQQEILNKMLESERAEREQDMDEQRQANEAVDQWEQRAAEFLEYQQLKQREVELLKSLPPGLNSYFKVKVTEYFNKFGATQ